MTARVPTLLLTGAGGAAIPFLVKSLKNHGYRVLTADMEPYAAGLFISDKGFVIPAAGEKKFIAAIQNICATESVDVIVPLVDEELVAVSKLDGTNVIPLIPKEDFIATCLDKFSLIRKLEEVHIPVPKTSLVCDYDREIGFPCIVKPRRGRGSRDVELIRSKKDFNVWLRRKRDVADQFILQEYIGGREYTVSVVVWRDGHVQAVVPKEIISKKGITRIAVTRHDRNIEKYCSLIQERLRADGPFNVQLRCDDDPGLPRLFEVNPRFSTTVSLTIMAGIDELHGLVQQALFGPQAYRFGNWDSDIVLMRFNEDRCTSLKEFRQTEQAIRKSI